MKLKNAIDWNKVNYDQFKKERRNSLAKFPKTKLELIEDIERFITTNLERVDIDKGQDRINWRDDSTIVFQVESMLQDVIIKLASIKLEDIK
tara:strand:- start:40 stop:315 length:276 start_codon:yes stop_codon:yes gene_type:complete